MPRGCILSLPRIGEFAHVSEGPKTEGSWLEKIEDSPGDGLKRPSYQYSENPVRKALGLPARVMYTNPYKLPSKKLWGTPDW